MDMYVKVAEAEDEESIELPCENDSSVLLHTLTAQFPGATGLKYRNIETDSWRGVKSTESPRSFLPPHDNTYWGDGVFIVVYPKENKRKIDEDSVSQMKKFHPRCCDLIVLGLPFENFGDDELKKYFSDYGDLKLCEVKKDQNTGKSKGFGFIKFGDYEAQRKVTCTTHKIGGRKAEVKIPDSKVGSGDFYRLFVGRLDESISADDLKTFFGQYGTVDEVYIPKPFRRFGFISFTEPTIAPGLVNQDFEINGYTVFTNNADPKSRNQMKFNGPDGMSGHWGKGGFFQHGSPRPGPGAGHPFRQASGQYVQPHYGGANSMYPYDPSHHGAMGYHGNAPSGLMGSTAIPANTAENQNVMSMISQLTNQVSSNPQMLQQIQALLTLTSNQQQQQQPPQQQQKYQSGYSSQTPQKSFPSDAKMDESGGGDAKWGTSGAWSGTDVQ